jgi:hypothetical protein
LRRLVHLALLLTIIIGVRACGGMTQAEDRLSAATRWTAEKAGLTGARDALDNKVRPSMTAAMRALAEAIFGGVSRTMDRAEQAADGFADWVARQVSAVLTAIETDVGSILTPNTQNEPQRPDIPKSERDRRETPAR